MSDDPVNPSSAFFQVGEAAATGNATAIVALVAAAASGNAESLAALVYAGAKNDSAKKALADLATAAAGDTTALAGNPAAQVALENLIANATAGNDTAQKALDTLIALAPAPGS